VPGSSLGIVGFLVATIAYFGAAVMFLGVWRHRVAGVGLAPAVVVTTLWAALLAWHEVSHHLPYYQLLLVELCRDFVWFVTISSILQGATGRHSRLVRFGGVMAVFLVFVIATTLNYLPGILGVHLESSALHIYAPIALALIGLIGLEQIFRNARPGQRPSLKYLCYGIASLFAYNLFMYAAAAIQGEVNVVFWEARGYVAAMAVPLLVVAVRRGSSWQRGLFASRQVVFYSATLLAAVVYFVVVGLFGLYIRVASDEWGKLAQLIFLSAAGLFFIILLFSDPLRTKLSVFLSKHFFESKYDYRNEWLRLIDTLTSSDDPLPLHKKCIKSLAQIVGAECGHLWLRDADRAAYDCVVGWNIAPTDKSIPSESDIAQFLQSRAWVVDLEKVATVSEPVIPIDAAMVCEAMGDSGLLIPLVNDQDLLGFVVLPERASSDDLDFEDYDLLKTAGRQIASYLLQETLTAKMSEARQFEAFNRLTAYLMHDLNNLVAQQSLIVENASQHKNNPEFVDDAIETVSRGVVRMRKVLDLLKQRDRNDAKKAVDIAAVVRDAVTECNDKLPSPGLLDDGVPGSVLADRSRLRMAIYHAIRNAQDATEDDGTISVSIESDDKYRVITVSDTGHGMEASFIRERLFKPFDTTKGIRGMGIGAYQIREYVREIGGRVEVNSEPGKGTEFRIHIPRYTRD